jgi:hypothetical protein
VLVVRVPAGVVITHDDGFVLLSATGLTWEEKNVRVNGAVVMGVNEHEYATL